MSLQIIFKPPVRYIIEHIVFSLALGSLIVFDDKTKIVGRTSISSAIVSTAAERQSYMSVTQGKSKFQAARWIAPKYYGNSEHASRGNTISPRFLPGFHIVEQCGPLS